MRLPRQATGSATTNHCSQEGSCTQARPGASKIQNSNHTPPQVVAGSRQTTAALYGMTSAVPRRVPSAAAGWQLWVHVQRQQV